MTKRIISLLTTIVMAISLIGVMPAMTVGAETSGDYKYTVLDDGTVEITDYSGDASVLEIPNKINGKTVKIIGDSAFWNCESLTSVIIPNSVTSIGDGAFWSCESLTSITIPDSVTSIGDYAFEFCESLTSITIPNSVTRIGDRAFLFCESLTSIAIPNSVTSIGYAAFENCWDLTSITIPNSVISIGDGALGFCYNLTSITIGNSVTSIGCGAFESCWSLTSITIPNSVTSIESGAFYSCRSLTSIAIPNSVTSIGGWAFVECYSLTSVTIPNSVASIGVGAFDSCSSLTSVTIPNSVTSIGDDAFKYCESLTSITIPDSVESIGDSAFDDCDSLTIKCYKGSYAEQYAIENYIKYEIIGEASSSVRTSIGYRYPTKYLFAKLASPNMIKYFNDDDTAVPGLETTNVTGVACDTMVPQGICTTDEYILITAYDDIYDKSENGEKTGGYIQDLKKYKSKGNNKNKLEQEKNHIKHNSVIYVLDKKTRNYKTTLVLPDQNHVGGITFDGKYAWIAKSTKNQLSAISLDKINEKVKQKQDSVNISYDKTLNCGMKASYITYNKTDDTLWIGYNNSSKTNYLKEYKFTSSKDTLTATNRKIDLPVYNTNGAVFAQCGNEIYLIVNVSQGRKLVSWSYVYKVTDLSNGKISKIVPQKRLASMSEEICIDGGKVYSIFESASTPYSTVSGNKCDLPVDRVCAGDLKHFLGVGGTASARARSLNRSYTTTDEDGNTYEYDDNGNITYFEDADGFWYRSEYDENGNEISCEYSDGYTYNNTYDDNGNMLTSYCTSSDGTWVKASYTESGNITSYEDSDEFWYKSEFDENENEIYYEDSDNYSYNQTYDEAGNLTYYKDNEGFWFEAEYDEDGNETYFENSEGYWSRKTYDENGEIVSSDEGNNDPTTTNLSQNKNTFQTTKSPNTNIKSTAIKKAKIKNLKAKAKGKKITVSWKKIKIAKGYQVQVATNKKFKKKKIVFDKFTKKRKLIIKSSKIKRKKTYYVRVRAYAKTNGKKAYGNWSKVVKKKVK